ncbi:MAG: glycosyltransferase [Bacteroidota bacterium]|nr:glycosyltransferase [Bacteroidota bacterium]
MIISFYERIEYLKLLFAGLNRQTYKNFEVVIADDGSGTNVVQQIENITKQSPFPVTHVWHEKIGFRKNKILNTAIEASNTDYLIFIDGDCIPHSEFIKEHIKYRQEGICLTGRRVNLSRAITEKLTIEKIKNGYLEKKLLHLIADSIRGNSSHVEKGIYFKMNFLREFVNKKKRGLLGCNFSVHKKDIFGINGFDERYEAPSIGEDSDVQYRLELTGVEIKSLNNIALQYHLYHSLQPRLQTNLDLFAEIKSSKKAFTHYWIKQNKE